MQSKARGVKSLMALVTLAVVLAFVCPQQSGATEYYWVGGTGSWEDPNNWSFTAGGPGGAGPPDGASDAFITQADDLNRTVDCSSPNVPYVAHNLTLDATGAGTVALSISNGTVASQESQYIGYKGTGIVNQSGGGNYSHGTFPSNGNTYLGFETTGSGTYNLSGGNFGSGDGSTYIGYKGTGVVNQSGGYFEMGDGYLYLGFETTGSGTYNLSGGVCIQYTGGAPYIGYKGTGIVNQTGGFFYSYYDGVLGAEQGSLGIYNLYDGQWHSTLAGLIVGRAGTGIFNQIGESSSVGMLYGLVIGSGATGSGTYNLNGGTLYSVGSSPNPPDNEAVIIGLYGEGTLNQSGGNFIIGEYHPDIVIAKYAGSKGTYNLSGGSVTARNIINNDTLNYSGGELNAGIVNNGSVNLSGSGTRTVSGDVVNNGTFKITHTTAVYTGTFTNNGAYISDPATQYFNDLIIGQTGYLIGQSNDKFYISGDFINHSEMNLDWNTMHAYLGFLDGTDNLHDLYVAGVDYGAKRSGYANNFSWGTLDATGDCLRFYDGNSEAGAALYLRELWGANITDDLIIANLIGFDGLDIYYLRNLAGNAYLGGLTYALSGGGYLRPSVPEPSTILLVGTGLVGLAGLKRRFKS